MYTSEQFGIMEVTGDRIKFATPEITELDSLVVNFDPVQDLHGYDYPWAPGAGINKIPYPYHHTTRTSNGITWTDNGDGTVTANGTATANTEFALRHHTNNFTLPVGNYILTGCPAGGSSTTYAIWFTQRNVAQSSWVNNGYDTGSGLSVSITNADYPVHITLNIRAGVTVDNMVFRPMLRLSSVTDASWSPYSNVCPITGWESVSAYVSPSTRIQDGKTYTVTFTDQGELYGGYVDLVTGELTVTYHFAELDGTEDWNISSTGTNQQRYSLTLTPKGKALGNAISNEFRLTESTATRQEFGLFIITSAENLIVYDTNRYFADLAAFKTWLSANKMEIAYELATPLTYQLDPQTVKTLVGLNYIWSDTGASLSTSFMYRKELQPIMLNYDYCWTYPKAYIDRMEATLAARIKALEDAAADAKGAAEDVIKATEPETVPEEITEPEEPVPKKGGK